MDETEPGDFASPPCLLHDLAPQVEIRRVQEPARREDGRRVLVERRWPRGLSRAAAEWRKDLAPSAALCRWRGHDPADWEEFARRYRAELALTPGPVASLRDAARLGRVTLVVSARDPERSSAAVLRDVLTGGMTGVATGVRPPGAPSPSGSAPRA